MPIASLGAVLLFQGQDSVNGNDVHLLMIFVAIMAVAMLVQALIFVGVAIGALSAAKAAKTEINELKGKLMPVIAKGEALFAKSDTLVGDLTPKIKGIAAKTETLIGDLTPQIKAISLQVQDIGEKAKVIAAHAEDISALAREKAHEFAPTFSEANEAFHSANQTVKDANQKTHEQVERVNTIVTSAIDGVLNWSKQVERTVTAPYRHTSGLVEGLKTGFSTLFKAYKGKPKSGYQPPSGTYQPSNGGGGGTAKNAGFNQPPTEAEATSAYPGRSPYPGAKPDLEF